MEQLLTSSISVMSVSQICVIDGSLHSLESEVVCSQLGVINHQVDATVDFGRVLNL